MQNVRLDNRVHQVVALVFFRQSHVERRDEYTRGTLEDVGYLTIELPCDHLMVSASETEAL